MTENKKILITGGGGFIGSHLAEELLKMGEEVSVLDDFSTGSLRNIEYLNAYPSFHLVVGSILDEKLLAELVEGAEIIYHLAAGVGVQQILKHRLTTLKTNVRGTENVLELVDRFSANSATRSKIKVIIASSSEVYGKLSKVPLAEEDDAVFGPATVFRWSYACAKFIDEFLSLSYYHEKELPIIILRFFNVIGPRQTGRYGMVVPRFVQQALNGEPITVYGDGNQLRSFTYVKDVVKAMIEIAKIPEAEGEIFNIGSGNEISINKLAETVKRTLNSKSKIVHIPYEQIFGEKFEDPKRRVPDISKLQKYMNYQPNNKLVEIIKEIAKYQQELKDG